MNYRKWFIMYPLHILGILVGIVFIPVRGIIEFWHFRVSLQFVKACDWFENKVDNTAIKVIRWSNYKDD